MELENKPLTESVEQEQPVTTEAAEQAPTTDTPKQMPIYKTTQEIVERITEIAHGEDNPERIEIDLLKSLFYKFHAAENEAKKQAFISAGGNPEDYKPEADEVEEKFKAELSIIRERRQLLFIEQEQLKADNLQKKLDILERIKAMITTPDEVNQNYQEFKQLQEQWKEIKLVPAERATELWKNYQLYVEQFYDLLQLNREAREYDFKKNLEIKTKLCETAEKLTEETDVVSAFYQLQNLHQQFREVGPVSKELREDVWNRFKAASTIINKRHQDYYLAIKEQEEQNLKLKTELCEKVEAYIAELPTVATGWEEKTNAILALQAEWKTIGFTAKNVNTKIFERFRAACDIFFTKKNEFFASKKEAYAANIEKKKALIEKAKALQDSTEWRSTADKLMNLQKEWKTIGSTPYKIGDQLWEEFIGACNIFFEARKAANTDQQNEFKDNLAKKREIVARLKELAENPVDNMRDTLKAIAEEFSQIGHVPFKEKDKIYTDYRAALDAAYAVVSKANAGRRLDRYKKSIKNNTENLGNERHKLMLRLESLKNELATVENNLSFFGKTTKNNPFIDGVKRQIEKIKSDIALTKSKIQAIDQADED